MRADAAVLTSHAADVARLADRAALIVVDAPIATALGRVLAERGEQWFDPWHNEVAALRSGGSFLDGAVRYWDATAPRRADIVAAHSGGGWGVVTVDASRTAELVLRDALRALGL